MVVVLLLAIITATDATDTVTAIVTATAVTTAVAATVAVAAAVVSDVATFSGHWRNRGVGCATKPGYCRRGSTGGLLEGEGYGYKLRGSCKTSPMHPSGDRN